MRKVKRISTKLRAYIICSMKCKMTLNATLGLFLDPSFFLGSGDLTLIVIITGYKTKLVGYTISTDIAIIKI